MWWLPLPAQISRQKKRRQWKITPLFLCCDCPAADWKCKNHTPRSCIASVLRNLGKEHCACARTHAWKDKQAQARARTPHTHSPVRLGMDYTFEDQNLQGCKKQLTLSTSCLCVCRIVCRLLRIVSCVCLWWRLDLVSMSVTTDCELCMPLVKAKATCGAHWNGKDKTYYCHCTQNKSTWVSAS